MKNIISNCLLILFCVLLMSSCCGKAGVKAVEAAQKALKKTPKENNAVKTGTLLQSGKYADDAVRVVDEMDNEEDDLY